MSRTSRRRIALRHRRPGPLLDHRGQHLHATAVDDATANRTRNANRRAAPLRSVETAGGCARPCARPAFHAGACLRERSPGRRLDFGRRAVSYGESTNRRNESARPMDRLANAVILSWGWRRRGIAFGRGRAFRPRHAAVLRLPDPLDHASGPRLADRRRRGAARAAAASGGSARPSPSAGGSASAISSPGSGGSARPSWWRPTSSAG